MCAKGAVAARIGGKSVCLRVGSACKATYNSIYKKAWVQVCRRASAQDSDGETTCARPYPDTRPWVLAATGPVGTANTTVTVELDDDPRPQFVFSQATMPSGMVTFVITSKCVIGCSFDIDGVKAARCCTRTMGSVGDVDCRAGARDLPLPLPDGP